MKKALLFLTLLLGLTAVVQAQEMKFGKVTKKELSEKMHPLDSTADAAYLFKYQRTYFQFNESQGGFDVITEYQTKIKIYTAEGFDKANVQISYYSPENGDREKVFSVKGYTYNLVNGKVEKEKIDSKNIFIDKKSDSWSVKKFALPNIKEGCVIEFKYKLHSPYHTYLRDLAFQSDIPIKTLEYKTTIPEYYKFNKQAVGFYTIQPKIINWITLLISPILGSLIVNNLLVVKYV